VATAQQVSFCFFVTKNFCCQIGNTASIFPEIFFIQYFMILVANLTTSSLSLFAYYKNFNISKTKKDIPKRKMSFLFCFDKQQLFLIS